MTSQRIQQQLKCPICLDRFNRPTTLPCQHSFCATCLEGLYERNRAKCAVCRRTYPIPADGFPISLFIQQMLDETESEMHQQAQNNPPAYVLPGQPVPNSTQPSSNNNEAARSTVIGNATVNRQDYDNCEIDFFNYFKSIRRCVRKVFSKFLCTDNDNKRFMVVISASFLLITFSRFVAGAAKLSSDCPKERNVAVYLFVKSIFGFAFWVSLLLSELIKKLMNFMDNRFIEVYVAVESLFALIWLIVGTVWTIGFRDEITDECPFYANGWNKHYINFALVLTIVDWIGIVAFMFYCCYIRVANSNDNQIDVVRGVPIQ